MNVDFAIAAADVDMIPEGIVDGGTGASLGDQASAVSDFRERGISERGIREVLSDHKFDELLDLAGALSRDQ